MEASYRIGIAISVHNRHKTAEKTLSEWEKFLPNNSLIVLVDDASEPPFKNSTFRFNENVGIAKTKNKCLHLLEDCDYIFLADDDVYPKVKDWHLPYINSGEPHLMMTFDKLKDGRPNGNKKVLSSNGLVSYNNPCGVLLFLKREVLNIAGGFDVNFKRYFFEHVEYSRRIHNLGLTKHMFGDIPNSLELFHSLDWASEVKSSVTENRSALLRENQRYYNTQLKSKEYKPYKPLPNYVLTTYHTKLNDPQRNTQWQFQRETISSLEKSIPEDVIFKVFTDADVTGNIFINGEAKHNNPYMARWFEYRNFLRTLYPHSFVACTDANDVEILRNPFPAMKRGVLYTGDETGQRTNSVWLVKHHETYLYKQLIAARLPLLNAGILCGEAAIVLEFCERMCELADVPGHLTDMLNFNWVAYKYFKGRLVHGPQVNTRFKAFETNNKVAWFRHK